MPAFSLTRLWRFPAAAAVLTSASAATSPSSLVAPASEVLDTCKSEDDVGGAACSVALIQRAQGARRAAGDLAQGATELVELAAKMQSRNGSNPNGMIMDMNGRPCTLCNAPLEGRTDREYEMRTDCGNHTSVLEPVKTLFTPLIKYTREASEEQPETNAWCELNLQKICADSIYNKDWLYQAKAVDYPRDQIYDPWYCHHNGWISQEIRDISHDFEALKKRSEEECRSEKYAHTGWNSTMRLLDFELKYVRGMLRGYPTKEEALYIGGWTCAMGSSGCDMAYCSYSFCDKGNGKFGMYDECEGWDPIKGMP